MTERLNLVLSKAQSFYIENVYTLKMRMPIGILKCLFNDC